MSVGINGSSDGRPVRQAHQCPLNPEHGWWPDGCLICVEEFHAQQEEEYQAKRKAFRTTLGDARREAMKASREADARRELKAKVDAKRRVNQTLKASRLSDRAKDAKRRTDIKRALIKAEVTAEQDSITQLAQTHHRSTAYEVKPLVLVDAAQARKLTPHQRYYLATWYLVPALYFVIAVVVNSPFGIAWFLVGLVWIALLLREASSYRTKNEAAALRAAKAPVEKARLAASIAELEKDNDIQSLEYRIAEMDKKLGVTPEKRSEVEQDWVVEQCEEHESGAHSAVPPPWEEP